jgi:hypothetical protein
VKESKNLVKGNDNGFKEPTGLKEEKKKDSSFKTSAQIILFGKLKRVSVSSANKMAQFGGIRIYKNLLRK